MGSYETSCSPSHIELSELDKGFLRDAKVSSESLELASRLLQTNHDDWHIFFRDFAGHNHIAHSILTCLALGATPEDIQRAYDDGVSIQRPIPSIDTHLLEKLADDETMCENLGKLPLYTTFLAFFQRHMENHGWKETVTKYIFSRSNVAERMMIRLYEGAFHPIIHLGFGIEFNQPCIVAEALAQAAAHDDSKIGALLETCEAQALTAFPQQTPKPFIQIVEEVKNDEKIRNALRWEDFFHRMHKVICGTACLDMAFIASQFRIKPEDLERRTAEMISTNAYIAGASQRSGRNPKIDFFYMHNVTSSIFLSILIKQDWIKIEDRVRLVEWKGRVDLAFYAMSGCAELNSDAISKYHNNSSMNMDWKDLYSAINQSHDDGHVAKMLRALKNGQEASKPYETGDFEKYFPVKGNMWLKVARMLWDSTKDCPTDQKWIQFTGFDMAWKRSDLA